MKINRISLLLIFALNRLSHTPDSQTVYLEKDLPLASQIKNGGYTYIILDNFDLKGDTLVMPPNCILAFKGGHLENGTIEGNKTVKNIY